MGSSVFKRNFGLRDYYRVKIRGEKNKTQENDLSQIDSKAYVRQQEDKICEILKRIDGVDPFVMIMLDTSSEQIYASKQNVKESKNGANTQKGVSKDLIFYGDGKKPILVKEIEPEIRGVAVICKGISNSEIQLKIINLVSTVLNLPANRVYVISAD